MKGRKKISSRLMAVLLAIVMIVSPLEQTTAYAGVLDTIGKVAPVFTVVTGGISLGGSIYSAVDCAIKADKGDGVKDFFKGLLGKKENEKLNGIESTVKSIDGKIDSITKTINDLSEKTDEVLTQVSTILDTLNTGVESITVNLYKNQLQMREWQSTYTQINNFYTKYSDVRRTLETTIETLNSRSADYDRFMDAVSAHSNGSNINYALSLLNVDCSNYDSLDELRKSYLDTSIELDGKSYTVYQYVSDYSSYVRTELKKIYDKFANGYSTDMFMSLQNMADYILGQNWTNGSNGGIGEIYYKLAVMSCSNSDEVHKAYQSFVTSVQYDFLLTAYVCSLSLKSQIACSTNTAEISTLTSYLNRVEDLISQVLNYSDYEYKKCITQYDFDGFTIDSNLNYDDFIVYYGNPGNYVNEGIEETRIVSRKIASWGGSAQASNQYLVLAAGESDRIKVWYNGSEIQGDYELSSTTDCVLINEDGTVVGIHPGTSTIRMKVNSCLYDIATVSVRSAYAKYNGNGTNTYVYSKNGQKQSYTFPGKGYTYEYCSDIETANKTIDSSTQTSVDLTDYITLQQSVSLSDYEVILNHKYGKKISSTSSVWVQLVQAYTGSVVLVKTTDGKKSVVVIPITNKNKTAEPNSDVTYTSENYNSSSTRTYYIYTKQDLLDWRNQYDTNYGSEKINVKLMADIDFEWGEWSGLKYALVQKIFPGKFTGDEEYYLAADPSKFHFTTYTFDGNGHTIKNINFISTENKCYYYDSNDNCKSQTVITYGFFSKLAGVLKNLTIENVKYTIDLSTDSFSFDKNRFSYPDILSVFNTLTDSLFYRENFYFKDGAGGETITVPLDPVNYKYPCEVLNCKVAGTTEAVSKIGVAHYDPFGGMWDGMRDTRQTFKVANCIYDTDFYFTSTNYSNEMCYFTAFNTCDSNIFAGRMETSQDSRKREISVVRTTGMTAEEKAKAKQNVRSIPGSMAGDEYYNDADNYQLTNSELTTAQFWLDRGWDAGMVKRMINGNPMDVSKCRGTMDISSMKRVYYVGEALDLNNLFVYDMNGTRVAKPSVSSIDTSTPGTKTVTVNLDNKAKASFTVKYVASYPQYFEYDGTTYTMYSLSNASFKMPGTLFTRDDGYLQTGWMLKNDESKTFNFDEPIAQSGSNTYVPTWEQGEMCTLTFGYIQPMNVPVGTVIRIPDYPDVPGYTPTYWYYIEHVQDGAINRPVYHYFSAGQSFKVEKSVNFSLGMIPRQQDVEITLYLKNIDGEDYTLLGTYSTTRQYKYIIEHSYYQEAFHKFYPDANTSWIINYADSIDKIEAEGYYEALSNGYEYRAGLGTTAISIWLKRPSFTVTWNDIDGNTLATESVKFETVPTPPADIEFVPAGYVPVWDKGITELMKDTTYQVTGKTPAPNVGYTVNHLWQNVGDDDYTLYESETLTGTTGLQTEAAAKNYAGVTPQSFSQTAIAGDGSTVVNIYYTRNLYTVTWDVEGVTSTENYRYGATPSYKGETPQKTADAQYTYAFNGWGEIAPVEDNVTYTAVFSNTLNKYTITWDIDGVKTTEEYNYGVTPSYKGETPKREANAQYTYIFKDWGTITEVTGDKTYKADFDATVNKYTITWDVDGEKVTEEYEYGQIPSYKGVTPKKDADAGNAYTFNGWGQIETVTCDKTYTAVFVSTANKYTITWDVNGEKQTELYDYGSTPSYKGVLPTKPATPQYSYIFAGWGEITGVTGNKTYTALFTSITNTYTVTWNIDGNQTTEEYAYGDTPSYKGAIPTRDADAHYTYSFRDWGTILTVTGDKTYTASFDTTVNKYNITWIIDGLQFTESYDYGTMPVYKGYTPTKAPTPQYTYTFTGWGEITSVTGNKTYTASFDKTVNTYTITWDVDGVQITEEYAYGATPSYKGTTPAKEPTAQYTYFFKGWGSILTVTGDKTYTASFDSTVNKYTVTWVIDGVPVSEEYDYGTTPSYKGGTPKKQSTAQTVYTFAGWGEISPVTGDKTYTAAFTEEARKYKVTWVIDGQQITEQYEYGKTPVYKGETPKKDNTTQYSYTFNGWGEIKPVADDATYIAEFTSSVITYTITWNMDGALTTEEYTYGETPSYKGKTPSKAADAQYSYSFTGWGEITAVDADKTYTAFFAHTVNKYSITWDVNGDRFTEEYEYGATPVYKGYKPTKPATEQYVYTFDGWGEITKVVADQTYTAVFAATYIVPSEITSPSYNITDDTVSKISAGVTSSEFLAAMNKSQYCKVFSGDTAVADDTVVGTGMTVKIMDGNSVKATYTAVVTGDTTGDGNITITDMLSIKAHILGKSLLTDAYETAADTNGDGTISITDFLQEKAQILGKGDIVTR